jgi:predicted nucleotidyltransferase
MMEVNIMTVEEIKSKIVPILKQHGIKKAAIFGSFVKGEVKSSSDVDVLVEIENEMSLLDFVGMKLELEEAINMKVDLVEYETIKPLLKDKILSEQVAIL